jgi:HD-GYP domain-containing protein (c-di-GMP phosphodiesterase class II)
MTDVYIKTSDLRPGIVLSENVLVNTNHAIIRKNTVLLPEHLEVLNAFGVREVKIEEQSVVKREEDLEVEDGEVNPDQVLTGIPLKQTDLKTEYRQTVEKYKREFIGWQAGTKPDIAKVRVILLSVLENFIKQKRMLNLLNNIANPKDYLYHHSIAVGVLASAISMQMGHPKGQSLQLGLAGVLADCGMAKIDATITDKAAFLTKEEFNEVKKHTIYSFKMVQDTPLLRQEMKLAIFQHHERLDGSGYPRGSKMEQITVFAQILAVADVFHAMTSERLYRSKESPFKVIEMIKEEEFGKFDLKVVQALHDLVGNLSIGMKVHLTNGETGEIIFIHRDARLRPMIKKEDGTILDLTINRRIAVEKVLD